MDPYAFRLIVEKLSRRLETEIQVVESGQGIYLHCLDLPFDLLFDGDPKMIEGKKLEKKTIRIHLQQFQQEEEKIISRLRVLSGKAKKLHARQTVLARIDKQVAMNFQAEQHLLIPLPGKYRYGLFHEGELVSVAIFSGGRKMRGESADYRSFELLRFCHSGESLVVGGLSKLLKGFVKDFSPGDIMTYVDKDWTQTSSLEKLGFKAISEREPQNYWISGEQQHLIHTPEALTVFQATYPNGYLLQSSGSIKLVLRT